MDEKPVLMAPDPSQDSLQRWIFLEPMRCLPIFRP